MKFTAETVARTYRAIKKEVADQKLRDDLAYQLKRTKIGRTYTFAAILEELTGLHVRTCRRIAKLIFQEEA